MTALEPTDVVVEDASDCILNGQPIGLEELCQTLANMRQQFAVVELLNQGASTRCELDFRVADESQLEGIETAFMRLARDRTLNIQAISRFNEDCRAFTGAMSYCDGISHYLYGVMAKERSSDSGLRREEYVERFLRASEQLSGYDRPLARCVRSLVAFHFNHFDEASQLAPEGDLRNTSAAFARLLNGLPWLIKEDFPFVSRDTAEGLLIDQDTLQILSDARHGIQELRVHADELMDRLRRLPQSGYDHMKRVLLACEALAICDDPTAHASARKLARQLSLRSDTITWAENMLERLKPYE
jgi:hypothetical protein